MRSPSARLATMLAGVLALSAAAPVGSADAPPLEVTWAQVGPLLRARFAVVSPDGKSFAPSSAAPLPDGSPGPVRDAIVALTSGETPEGAEVLRRIALDISAAMAAAGKKAPFGSDRAADSERYREALLAGEHASRLLRNGLASLLRERGVACADCAVPEPGPRDVRFAELVPYLARFVTVGRGDLTDHAGFHVCTGINGLSTLASVDPELAAASVAAMFRVVRDHPDAIEKAGAHVAEARRKHPGPESPDLLGAVNAEVWEALAHDGAFLDDMRMFVASEAEAVGLTCRDCLPAPHPRDPASRPDPTLDAGGAPKLSPFGAVRWSGDTAQVQLSDDWYELRAIDGMPAPRIIAFCHAAYGDAWRKRFEEDLVAVLRRMGHPPAADVALDLVRLDDAKPVQLARVPMTKAHRDAIRAAAAAAR